MAGLAVAAPVAATLAWGREGRRPAPGVDTVVRAVALAEMEVGVMRPARLVEGDASTAGGAILLGCLPLGACEGLGGWDPADKGLSVWAALGPKLGGRRERGLWCSPEGSAPS